MSVVTDYSLGSELSFDELFSLVDALLISLARDHEGCCPRAAYALELASGDLTSGPRRPSASPAPALVVPAPSDRVLVLGLLDRLIPLAVDRDEEEAIISAHYWTSLARLDH